MAPNGYRYEGDQKVFCSPFYGLSNPRRLASATTIRVFRASGTVSSGLLGQRHLRLMLHQVCPESVSRSLYMREYN